MDRQGCKPQLNCLAEAKQLQGSVWQSVVCSAALKSVLGPEFVLLFLCAFDCCHAENHGNLVRSAVDLLQWWQNPRLAEMLADLEAMQKEQAAVAHPHQEEPQKRTEHQMQVIEDLAAKIRSWPPPRPSPPASPKCVRVAEVWSTLTPVPVPRVRAPKAQPPSAPVHTPWVGAASARQEPAPVPVPWRSSAEQLPPPVHSPAQRLKSQQVLPSWSRRLKRWKDVLGLGWWTTCRRDLPSWGRRSGPAGGVLSRSASLSPDTALALSTENPAYMLFTPSICKGEPIRRKLI